MLTESNLAQLLTNLGFEKKASVYRKFFETALLEVNFDQRTISYPEANGLLVNERQTCNFEANENFVVLECVHRLLEKGYKPEHIELEPKWKLGRGASGGRADVLIKDNAGRPLLIIECKTAGAEFKRAWNKTLQDGDQLFSYAQQISETQFLCLYTSDLDAGAVSYTSHIIAHRDNEKYLADNPLFKSFKSVTDVEERYAVWRDTYKLDYTTKGIFEETIQPYHIGKDKYSLADLHAISASDQQKKYHEFATILRQHNVSGRENAFDKLVNLFLCKLVDEIENPSDLKFYWKGVAYDTHFDLMDRMQQLYQAGMGKFLGEDITYINQSDVNNALRFIKQNPDATQRAVWNLFIQQKFFTNNDFSLIDVHNEKLFYQNAEVLLKILQMWQDIRLTDPHGHNQFLGDMFEGFLDQGIKQSEGQFFTPMPICRFILMSLPLASFVQRSATPPKAIDYACGAGHFLTELALQLKPLVQIHQPEADLSAYHKALYGIEKEYRLSKVAKVSAFMYGQQGINICYGDGLINQHEAFPDIKDASFDLLVANPPYSVRGFLETLPEEERKAYTLAETINDLETFNSIETFFIERAKQLLRAGGVAAIILPSSILSNGASAYIRTREILIQYFDIVAIAEFGSGTFGKTGTNTVTLFLRRKKTAPDTAAHYRERVEEWFKGDDADTQSDVIYKDEHLIARYATHINVPLQDYKTLLKGDPDGAWATHLESIYLEKFNASTEVTNLYKAKWFKGLKSAEQEAEINKRYLAFVQGIERDKLYHFVMACDQPNPVLIIRSPSEPKAIKQFLGYEWSSAKGDEGIKLIKDPHGRHLTPLYDETNRDNGAKLNSLVSANFDGKLSIPESLVPFSVAAALTDMLDFSRVTFEKQLSITPNRAKATVSSKWPNTKLANVAQILNGGTPSTSDASFWEGGDICWATLVDTKQKYLVDTKRKITSAGLKYTTLLPINTVIFSSRATIGEVCINKVPTTTNQGYKNFVCDPAKLNFEYLYEILVHFRPVLVDLVPAGSKYKEINGETIAEFEIPLPPLIVQQEIVFECQVVEQQVENAKITLQNVQAALSIILVDAEKTGKFQQLGKVIRKISDSIDPQSESGVVCYVGLENIESGTGYLTGELRASYAEIKSVKKVFKAGDILYGKLRPNLNKVHLAKNDGICSTDILVLRANSNEEKIFYKYYFLSKSFNDAVVKTISGQQLPRTSWDKMQVIEIPILDSKNLTAVVAKIEALEKQIAEAQAVIDGAAARKQAILQKYL